MRENTNIAARVIRVLVADDSLAVQEFLREILDEEPDMLVVGTARNGEEVVAMTRNLKPDLITMDADMPRMDGVEATRRIMAECPTPIALVTAAPVGPGSDLAFNAVAAGAVEVMAKPRRHELEAQPAARDALVRQLRNVAYVRVVGKRSAALLADRTSGAQARLQRRQIQERKEQSEKRELRSVDSSAVTLGSTLARAPRVIAVGASTGGPPALRTLLSGLDPENTAPIVLVQHMSGEFLPGFATWLDGVIPLKVCIAESGAQLRRGHVYVAAGDRHMVVSGGRLGLIHGAPVQYQCPSVDVLFDSVARHYGADAVGILLTGMGRDGAEGLLAMLRRGALTMSQDAESSLVYGMPKAAAELGASRIATNPSHMTQLLRHMGRNERQVG